MRIIPLSIFFSHSKPNLEEFQGLFFLVYFYKQEKWKFLVVRNIKDFINPLPVFICIASFQLIQ